MDYNETSLREESGTSIHGLPDLRNSPTVTWLDVDGIHDVHLVSELGEIFGIHPLIQEDIVNSSQRPKIDDLKAYIFIVLNMPSYDRKEDAIIPEQISLVLGKHFLLTFQERPGDPFDGIRRRIRSNLGKLRQNGPDFLAYSILDQIVDNYFDILENIAETIELLEDEIVNFPSRSTLPKIHKLKTDMILLRKSVWPMRECISKLVLSDSTLLNPELKPYFRDVYDHTIHIVDTMETYRDIVSGMLDIYLSTQSNRLNEIMKVLTIIATIFIPLTFLSGWYGMNFKYMPELEWHYGYFMVMGVAATIATAMLLFFKKKGWF
jgi:magnesium transporter